MLTGVRKYGRSGLNGEFEPERLEVVQDVMVEHT
jgi:hypothetical protein